MTTDDGNWKDLPPGPGQSLNEEKLVELAKKIPPNYGGEPRYWVLPPHMQEAMRLWIEKAEPHPDGMGGFMRSLLSNDFIGVLQRADTANREVLLAWAYFLCNDIPSIAWGSLERMHKWYVIHHDDEPHPAASRTP